jgi:pyruvate dehydrogenase E2 component (dihydrolipoamide acetyltransferase)
MSTNILMPALSPTMEEGKLAKWHVKEGDAVKAGDILAEIETDKATMEFEAIDEGRIGKILIPEGAEGVKVNVPIAILETEDGQSNPKDIPGTMQAIREALVPVSPIATPKAAAPTSAAVSTAPRSGNGAAVSHTEQRIFASPLAKRIAERDGIDIASVQGSGPRGRIVKSDVEAAAKGGAPKPAEPRAEPVRPIAAPEAHATSAPLAPLPDARLFYKEGEYEAVPNDSMRKAIARRLTSAKSLIPHYYLTIDCDIGALMQLRARLNEKSPKAEGAYKLSINDFVIKAAAMALMKHPDVNASWTEAAILKHIHADIGIAVDLNPGLPPTFQAKGSLVETQRDQIARQRADEGGRRKAKAAPAPSQSRLFG